ncbi:MAG: coenzyme F420-0:L-glutamate ligase [Candidatus Bathyarchaeia archaeon]
MKNNVVQIIGIEGIPIVKAGDNIAELICKAAEEQGTPIRNGDIIVVAHIIVSRAEGRVLPSAFARNIAELYDKDPALVEVVLREAISIRRMADGKIITETRHGFVCSNSGVDKSNVPGRNCIALLPEDPDASAKKIRLEIKRLTGCDVAVIISDTHGRPLRKGEVNVAVGVSGLKPIRDRRGEKDLFGYVLRVKQTAVADELASAAELVMGQADEGIPAAIIRGYKFVKSEDARATELVRPRGEDLFF